MLIKTSSLKKIPYQHAVDILQRYQQDKSLKAQVSVEMSPVQLINQLYDNEQWYELVTFLCHALPARESIWWGYSCIQSLGSDLPEIQKKALDIIFRWLQEPTEANRRLAELLVKQCELDNACGWLAQAVFWSGGSITPVNGPESPAPPFLYSHAVAGAICLAAVLPDGSKGESNYKDCIASGIDIASGGTGRA